MSDRADAIELLPCPFCGGQATPTGSSDNGYGVTCLACDFDGPNRFSEKVYAATAWNNRAALALPPEQGELNFTALEAWVLDERRKRPELAFTAGPERRLADLIDLAIRKAFDGASNWKLVRGASGLSFEPKATDMESELARLQAELSEAQAEAAKWHRIRTHGCPCCTCQGCGLTYEDCRCELDEALDELQTLRRDKAVADTALSVLREALGEPDVLLVEAAVKAAERLKNYEDRHARQRAIARDHLENGLSPTVKTPRTPVDNRHKDTGPAAT